MSIRLPLTTVLGSTNDNELGAGSVNGVVAIPFTIPTDTDNITLKLVANTAGGAVSAQLQTTDDGGNTWYGLARTSVVSLSTGDTAQWLSVPVAGFGFRSASVIATGSVFSGISTGSAAPSTLGTSGGYTGLPVMSQLGRVALQIVGNLTTSSIFTQVKVNSQAPHA